MQETLTFNDWFNSRNTALSASSIQAVLTLSEEGATLPFIARYRKEKTGNLDEVQIQSIIDGHNEFNEIIKRKEFILKEIKSQEKLTPELEAKIAATYDKDTLEDLYLPYKQKKKTKAVLAKEAGIEPFSLWLLALAQGKETSSVAIEAKAQEFINAEKKFETAESVLTGAQDILIERFSEDANVRSHCRDKVFKEGGAVTGKGSDAKPNSKFELYFEHREPVSSLMKPQASHRYMAMRRGWMENELTLKIEAPEDELLQFMTTHFEIQPGTTPAHELCKKSLKLALKGPLLTSIESEVHRNLKDIADEAAIHVFAENIKKLLLAAPFGSKSVVGIDPGIRTGCKMAIVDQSSKFLINHVIHLQTDSEKEKSKEILKEMISKLKIEAIAIGNGTAGRETETFVRKVVEEADAKIPVVMVNEAGASVYSASEVARDEFPDLDVTVRGAISIARRLQDPLAELVKVDPKSVGVGQYQHDVNQSKLKKELDQVVMLCVNSVGIDLNTASKSLLSYVSGIGPSVAQNIVEFRNSKGLFTSRQELLNVPRFSQKTFEQAAGFLRVRNGINPLDNTGVHPERYNAIEAVAREVGGTVNDFLGESAVKLKEIPKFKELVGEFTSNDIIQELLKPGRDPRENFVPFHFREDIHTLEDLKEGLICPGIVTNVTNFGAFVDIGVHQDGLVHLSVLADRFITDPREVVSPGDRVQVKVLKFDKEKKQISLSMRLNEGQTRTRERGRDQADAGANHGGRGRRDGHENRGAHGNNHGGGYRPHGDQRNAGGRQNSGHDGRDQNQRKFDRPRSPQPGSVPNVPHTPQTPLKPRSTPLVAGAGQDSRRQGGGFGHGNSQNHGQKRQNQQSNAGFNTPFAGLSGLAALKSQLKK